MDRPHIADSGGGPGKATEGRVEVNANIDGPACGLAEHASLGSSELSISSATGRATENEVSGGLEDRTKVNAIV
jgi:hypothetical protein